MVSVAVDGDQLIERQRPPAGSHASLCFVVPVVFQFAVGRVKRLARGESRMVGRLGQSVSLEAFGAASGYSRAWPAPTEASGTAVVSSFLLWMMSSSS